MATNAPTQSCIDPDASVNALLARFPDAVTVLRRYGLETCCGGGLPLRSACLNAGADLDAVLSDLAQVTQEHAS